MIVRATGKKSAKSRNPENFQTELSSGLAPEVKDKSVRVCAMIVNMRGPKIPTKIMTPATTNSLRL
jgi:hypothetical protein